MQEASPFSSLEHAISFARDLWFNKSPIRTWLDAFSAHRHIGTVISRAPTELISDLCQFGAKYRKKFGFEFLTTTNARHSHKILKEIKILNSTKDKRLNDTNLFTGLIIKARCGNNLLVELDIAAREKFYFIQKGLTKIWERISQEELQEKSEDLGEIVSNSLEEELVPSNSSDKEVWIDDKATLRNYDLNKTPDENQIE
ncbi:uric acid degradation bifunctional protein TTL-like [Arachis duranensis]|uniref:Uric acid degradation bifunctional protein TTL-like n=1 Tax=Arachis duranensis TaxID=130453 RepID=A0A6P5NRI1_ARADU|nr:uric acid degradation bifunctional protein TTL-like [Arachis duranensis]